MVKQLTLLSVALTRQIYSRTESQSPNEKNSRIIEATAIIRTIDKRLVHSLA